MDKQLVYVADPMCSWCWGFSPVVAQIRETFDVPIQLVMGGLRPGETRALDASTAAMIREHWEHVHTASGQPFDFDFFDREGFVYDTEPVSRAVVTVRHLEPALGLDFLARAQRAFYAEGRDTTDSEVLVALAGEAGVDAGAFQAWFDSAEAREETRRDFELASSLGVRGFPTLLTMTEGELGLVTVGYRPWDRVKETLSEFVTQD